MHHFNLSKRLLPMIQSNLALLLSWSITSTFFPPSDSLRPDPPRESESRWITSKISIPLTLQSP